MAKIVFIVGIPFICICVIVSMIGRVEKELRECKDLLREHEDLLVEGLNKADWYCVERYDNLEKAINGHKHMYSDGRAYYSQRAEDKEKCH